MRSISLRSSNRDLITRRDLEELLGVSPSRAAALMRVFGAELAGTILVLQRGSLLRTFQQAIADGSFTREIDRRDRFVGIPVKWNSVSGDLEHGFRRSGTLVGA